MLRIEHWLFCFLQWFYFQLLALSGFFLIQHHHIKIADYKIFLVRFLLLMLLHVRICYYFLRQMCQKYILDLVFDDLILVQILVHLMMYQLLYRLLHHLRFHLCLFLISLLQKMCIPCWLCILLCWKVSLWIDFL